MWLKLFTKALQMVSKPTDKKMVSKPILTRNIGLKHCHL